MTASPDAPHAKPSTKDAAHPPDAATGDPTPKRHPFRIVAFPGGGMDTAMQLGVIHAFLVARRKAPDLVAGISAGAIHAAAMAEVLQEKAPGATDETDHDVQRAARFREFLEAFHNAPSTAFRGFFPDPLETSSASALKAVRLPRHFKEERKDRIESVATRTGLIRLLNHLFRVSLTVRTVTRLVRVVLGCRAAGEMPDLDKIKTLTGLALRAWWIIATHLPSLSLPASRILRVYFADGHSSRSDAVDAAQIIFNEGGWRRWMWDRACWFALGFVPLALAVVLCPLLVLAALGAAALFVASMFCACKFSSALLWALAWGIALLFWVVYKSVQPAGKPPRTQRADGMLDKLLKHYRIFTDLGDSYPLKEEIVRLFDPNYYGSFDFEKCVGVAMRKEDQKEEVEPETAVVTPVRKLLGSYDRAGTASPAMHVAILAANLKSGELEAISQNASVVDALMGATAVVPFFKVQEVKEQPGDERGNLYIDGVNVSNDPITPAFDEARRIMTGGTRGVFDYARVVSVPLLPVKTPDENSIDRDDVLADENHTGDYTGLLSVAARSLKLQRFQGLLNDTRLVNAMNMALGGSTAQVLMPGTKGKASVFPAFVRMVSPDEPHDLNTRLLEADTEDDRRRLVDKAAADGCRAMIERWVADALTDSGHADEWPPREGEDKSLGGTLAALATERKSAFVSDGKREFVSCAALLEKWAGTVPLPGAPSSGKTAGPGVSELCGQCAHRCGEAKHGQVVRLPAGWRERRALIAVPAPDDESDARQDDLTDAAVIEKERREREEKEKEEAEARAAKNAVADGAKIVFLFSGGVFRGVFQVGMANAVSELNIKPDAIAGASVGTIMGALVGRVFQSADRPKQMRLLASTFLTIDRFVLTDRFADFVRHVSIHASAADFSLYDIDRAFRRFDEDRHAALSRHVRRVVAGVERIFCITPAELLELALAFRAGEWSDAKRLITLRLQEMMDRYGVSLEILGAEPLRQLIDGFVFNSDPDAAEAARLDHFSSAGKELHIMGTTTDLTNGRLLRLRASDTQNPRLTESLLASSAFPAVFRPRWSWEVYRKPNELAQFADGGVMDNLPFDAVVDYLWTKKNLNRRPEVPHLILTATLEPVREDWSGDQRRAEEIGWREARERAKQLSYNGKIDKFQKTQRFIRAILKEKKRTGAELKPGTELPLDLEVVAVKPQWLCGTFAFHPMLGFKRKNQCASIAHGCASTFCELAAHFDENNREHGCEPAELRKWAIAKEIKLDQLHPKAAVKDGPAAFLAELKAGAVNSGIGQCWFRKAGADGVHPVCPFFCTKADEAGENRRDLHAIYVACGTAADHKRDRPA